MLIKILVKKCLLKIFGQKIKLGKKILNKRKYWSERFGSEIFLSLKKQIGLTQGGEYMNPPPKK